MRAVPFHRQPVPPASFLLTFPREPVASSSAGRPEKLPFTYQAHAYRPVFRGAAGSDGHIVASWMGGGSRNPGSGRGLMVTGSLSGLFGLTCR